MRTLRRRIGHWLRRLAHWIDPPDQALLIRALDLVRAAESFTDASGEYKRHRVYAQLLKEFPRLTARTVALAIELAVQKGL